MRAKIVIVGGGVMGVSIALHAARRTDPLKEPVVLIERRTLAAGSSGRSGAVLRQYYSAPLLAGMARDSLAVYASFERRTGRSLGFERCGVMTLAASTARAHVEELERTVERIAALGIEMRRVDAGEIRRLIPSIAVDDATIGAFEPGGGFVDPRLTVDAFAALARTYGAIIRPGQEVEEILFRQGRVSGVETAEERIDCEAVVVAAGPWTPRLLARHGIESSLSILRTEQHFVAPPGAAREQGGEVEPDAPSESLGAGAADLLSARAFPEQRIESDGEERFRSAVGPARATHPVVLDQELGFYTRCEPLHHRTRVGRLVYDGEPAVEDPDNYSTAIDPGFREWARAVLSRRLPIYQDVPDLDDEAALYTMSPDAQAVIGPIASHPGLYVVSGFSGHGFKLAPSVGEGVAQMLAGEPVSALDPEFFSPARFASGAPARSARPFGL